MEDLTAKESLTHPQNAWLFDVDGVITNPLEKAVTEPEIIPEIIKRLRANEPVSLVSGRALPWLLRTVVAKIEEQVQDRKLLDNLFVSAEFGGIAIYYQNGEQIKEVDEDVSLPHELIARASDIVINNYSNVAFVDPEKVTHFTAEMVKGVPMEDFKAGQAEFSAKFRDLVEEFGVDDDTEVHNDRIATNIKNRKLNKHLAVQKVLEWLNRNGSSPQIFHVFGDSHSDLEMGRELHDQGKNLRFIFVGEEYPGDQPFEVIHQGNVDKGTLEYLQGH